MARAGTMAVAAAACVGGSQAFVTPMATVSAGATSAATRHTSSLTMAADNSYHKKDFWIAPSILSADMAKLGEEVDNAMSAGADIVHFDVMDNHYVPNLTIGPLVCKGLRDHGVTKPIDVHLMVSPVDRIVGDFAEAGASFITFHPEASPHVDRTLGLIKSYGCKAGTYAGLVLYVAKEAALPSKQFFYFSPCIITRMLCGSLVMKPGYFATLLRHPKIAYIRVSPQI